ncbi:MAG: M23 family metallopeptidase [Eubacteriales bacterium]
MSTLTHRVTPTGRITQRFREYPTRGNPHPVYGDYQPAGHTGQDEAANLGDPVTAAAAGQVVYAGPGELMPPAIANEYGYWSGPMGWSSGNITIIRHSPRLATTYSHQNDIRVAAGQWVNGGDVIGGAGNTGRSQGVHVHLEAIMLPVNYADPLYSRVDPHALYTDGGVAVAGNITNEEDELNTDQNNALSEAWQLSKRNNQILEVVDINLNGQGRVAKLMSTVDALAKALGKPDVDVEKIIKESLEETASTHYVKAKDNDTVYALIVETGELRPVKLPEWNVANAAGIPLRIVPQKFIDAAPKMEVTQ